MGSVTISFAERTARTILPAAPNIDHFDSFSLLFTATTLGETKPPIPLSRSDLSGSAFAPIDLVPGTYTLEVTAYVDGLTDDHIAAEGITTGIVVDEGDNTNAEVVLRMSLLYGMGTFAWNITNNYEVDPRETSLTVTKIGEATPAISIPNHLLEPEQVNINNPGTRPLSSGVYNVELVLRSMSTDSINPYEMRVLRWYEILHVYSTLTSTWTPVFEEEHYVIHPVVYFDYLHSSGDVIGQQSVIHGTSLGSLPSGQQYGRVVENWYYDTDYNEPWVPGTIIYQDITLYVKWVIDDGTATIGLIVDPIPNHTPTFEIALSNSPFAPLVTTPNPIVLSRSGNPNPSVYYFRISSNGYTADSVRWQVGNNTPVTGDTFTLSAASPALYAIGGHTLRLTVTNGGVDYMRNIPFTVVAGNLPPNYSIGDPGPGGGIIFYFDPAGFTVQGYGNPGDTGYFAAYTAHYLEAAPENSSVNTTVWASENNLIPNLSQTASDEIDWAIGRGRMNTAIIIAHGISQLYTTPAASACRNYRAPAPNNSWDDWFLPSRNELNELAQISGLHGIPDMGQFWSSSQDRINIAWGQRFDNRFHAPDIKNTGAYVVRPVRAF